jgi:hypothetical protein
VSEAACEEGEELKQNEAQSVDEGLYFINHF